MRLIDADKIPYSWQVVDGKEHDGVTLESIIDTIPTVYVGYTWNPCKNRLPDAVEKSYLVQLDSGHIHECRWTDANPFWTNEKISWHWNIFDIPQYTKVVAWMEKPNPYIEEEES